MQSQLPPGIEKLVRIEPQQLKSEQQLSQPSQSASHVPARAGQQQLPHMTMPLAQWQVVRMLYPPHSSTATSKEALYQVQQMVSPTLRMPTENGILTAKFELEGQVHQVRWQIAQGEAVLLASTLASEQALKLIPSISGGWHLVSRGMDMVEPLQLLWGPNNKLSSYSNDNDFSIIWLKRILVLTFGVTAILLLVI
ncbi:hypothetical protein GT360_13975 [Vibrio astriarenae]|uniref:Uncharacterized protein n=1 Tax=Vibrio astriarenae TaxID=1481923 RepID=A0A7Z2T5B6_9VIBR|nr:hypothetical protein [Vibrio astriarenae]QIA64530.1 hypothetical protein GT360_13975 [Vibrio astriarenae]